MPRNFHTRILGELMQYFMGGNEMKEMQRFLLRRKKVIKFFWKFK